MCESYKADDRWIAVEDRLPEAFEDVLIFNEELEGIDFAHLNSDGRWFYDRGQAVGITHWMPQPGYPASSLAKYEAAMADYIVQQNLEEQMSEDRR